MISGWILIFCISMRELVASLMLRPPNTDTSSTFIYRQFEQGDSAQGMAMALMSIGITSVILIALEVYQRKAVSSSLRCVMDSVQGVDTSVCRNEY